MSWLQQIPLLNLSGPDFLDFYGAVALFVLAATYVALRLADRSDSRPPPAVPAKPDPIETAYLAGGVNDVLRMIVYDLTHRGFTTLGVDDRLTIGPKRPERGELNAMERCVLEAMESKPTTHEIFEDLWHHIELERMLAPIRAKLEAEELLQPASFKRAKTRAEIIGSAVLALLVLAKLYVAWAAGRANVAFLIFLSIAAIALLFALTYVMSRGVASRRGRAYLADMKVAYSDRFRAALAKLGPKGAAPSAGAAAFGGPSLFLIGLYGFSALKGTTDAAFAAAFRRASGDSAGSCGSSCSAGGDSDGGGGYGGYDGGN